MANGLAINRYFISQMNLSPLPLSPMLLRDLFLPPLFIYFLHWHFCFCILEPTFYPTFLPTILYAYYSICQLSDNMIPH